MFNAGEGASHRANHRSRVVRYSLRAELHVVAATRLLSAPWSVGADHPTAHLASGFVASFQGWRLPMAQGNAPVRTSGRLSGAEACNAVRDALVAMRLSGDKTESIYRRYAIVSE